MFDARARLASDGDFASPSPVVSGTRQGAVSQGAATLAFEMQAMVEGMGQGMGQGMGKRMGKAWANRR